MGISSDGQISFGIAFEEGYQFPWDDEKWGGNVEDWWSRSACGYVPLFEIYDELGEYINGEKPSEEKKDAYYEHLGTFKANNPMPVEIIEHCSYDYPMRIVAAKDTYFYNSRGYQVSFDPKTMNVSEDQKKSVIDFCEKYCIAENENYEFPEMEPRWYLTSMFG